ncbi:MAG TPA: DUF3291 domain-containing protein [Roseiarcus sp.]|nr:DUF3291 domain-containing protein [Roseiarcus sp.]
MAATHIAQLNIGRLLYPVDDARIAEFRDNLDRVNVIAERNPGFVWRLKDDSNNATAIRPFDDPDMLVNMSIWESVEALERFVWATVHKQFYNRKGAWFEKLTTPHFVMWTIEAGHIPDLEEAKARLEHLASHGDSDYAFGWGYLPHIRLWMSRKCG